MGKIEQRIPNRRIFRNKYGHLRAGWRIAAYLLFIVPSLLPTIAILKLIGWMFPRLGKEGLASPVNIIFAFCLSLTLVLAAYGTLRWIDKRPYPLLGLNFSFSSIREFLSGFAIGAANLALVVLLLWALGFLQISWHGVDTIVLKNMGVFAVFMLSGAMIEEVTNRGYVLQALCEGTRNWIAVFVLSLVFSIVHLFNSHMTLSSVLFLFIHGVLYALAYLKTRSLWTAIGVHWSWNWMQGPVFGVNVSGAVMAHGVFTAQPRGTEIFSGGAFGVEGSILACALSIGFVAFVWRTKWLTPSAAMTALWEHYPRGFRLPPKSAKP